MNTKTSCTSRKLIATLLTVVMLISALSVLALPVAADDTPARDISESLLIHYDFEGDTLEKQLSDKAGDVNTNLTFVDKAIEVDATTGAIADASKADAEAINTNYSIADGKLEALEQAAIAPVTGITADTKAIQTTTNGTWYLRVNVPAAGWGVLLNFRKGPSDARPLYFGVENSMMQAYVSGYNTTELGWVLFTEDRWTDFAIVRTYTEGAEKPYVFDLMYLNVDTWTSLGTIGATSLPAADDVVLALFTEAVNGNVPASIPGMKGMIYDDIRYYTEALTADELTAIASSLKEAATPDTGDTTTTEDNTVTTEKPNDTVTTEKPADVTTKSATTTAKPAATEAPATGAPAAEEKKGCSAAVGVVGVLMLPVLAAVAYSFKKKED